jgi:hypothetical protein
MRVAVVARLMEVQLLLAVLAVVVMHKVERERLTLAVVVVVVVPSFPATAAQALSLFAFVPHKQTHTLGRKRAWHMQHALRTASSVK